MRSGVVLLAWIAICAPVGQANAQPSDATKNAQAAFDRAELDYLQGDYDDAAREFEDAYAQRHIPTFLYNAGASYHMKGKKSSDIDAYQKAVTAYRKYLAADPRASDKAKVEKAISVLEKEIKRLKEHPAAPRPSADTPSQLGDATVRGLVVIESEPSNASIYVDDRRTGAFATTPWSGTLEGDHKIIIEKRGYTVVEQTVSVDPTKLVVLRGAMSPQIFLGWVEITSNVSGADVFIDDKAKGAVGRTPISQNIEPGKHTFWVSAHGYDEYRRAIDVIANEVTTIKAPLKGAPVSRLNITGPRSHSRSVPVHLSGSSATRSHPRSTGRHEPAIGSVGDQ